MTDAAALTTVINKAVEISANLIVETGSRLYRLKEDIGWLERKMRHFKSCIKDAESKQVGSHEVANLINDMRDLALDMEDILDTYLPEIESHSKGKGPIRFLKHAACVLCYGATLNTFSLKIEDIKEHAQEIEATRERCRIISTDAEGGNVDADIWERRRKFLVAGESVVVGREDTMQQLKEKLLSMDTECKKICIVGEGGVGKTTVGKKIFRQVQNEFHCAALVYVSNEPRVQELLLEMAKQVGFKKEEMKENLEVDLRSFLENKKCLIVLDDIWKTEVWDELKNALPINSSNGSRIVITSRYTNVGRHIGGESSLSEMKILNEEKSWELFSNLLLSPSKNTSDKLDNLDLEDIGGKIVKRCGGLPLAIVVAVGMLRQRRRSKAAWNEVLDSLGTLAERDCSGILYLSYKDLPADLRPLFLYFGRFPEDTEVFVDNLVKAWEAEKLIKVEGERSPDDVGGAKLEMLNDRNLIQISRKKTDGVASYRIHDLLHRLCIDIARDNGFFSIFRYIESDSLARLRRLMVEHKSNSLAECLRSPNSQKLRSLLCFNGTTIPDEIGNLSNLTHLKLVGHFQRMPASISNLKKLVTLDAGEATFRIREPRSILRMKCLKHLLIKHPRFYWDRLIQSKEVYFPNIETLNELRLHDLTDTSLRMLSNLRMLGLEVSGNKNNVQIFSGTTPIPEKLSNLRLTFFNPIDLARLNLNLSQYTGLVQLYLGFINYGSSSLPGLNHFPPNLEELELYFVDLNRDSYAVLQQLPKLKILKFDHTFARLDIVGSNSFPELQVLVILGNDYFRPSNLFVDDFAMPKLRKFVLNCPKVNSIRISKRLKDVMVSDGSLYLGRWS